MLWYGILGIATGFWIYYDCKRIGYESKLKYLYLLLSVVLPPFFFVYLCVTGKQRKQGAKPCLVAHPLFWSVLCLAGCFVFVKTTPLPDMLETRYIKEKAVAESELERAKVRLAEMGTTEAVLHPMSENICWYMAEQLPEDARFVASGAVYGTDWMMGKEEAASLRFEVYLYERAAEATDSKRHFMAVSTFQWSDSVRIDYGRFKLLVPEGFAMEEQELKLRVWAKKTAAARYVDASVYGFGERMQGYQFVGKSMIAGYPYSGCVIAYFQGTDVPEEINFSYAHENGKTVGVVETVKLDFVSEQKRELFGTSETGNAAENHISKFEYSKELESKLAAEDLKQLKERLQGEFALEILEQTEAGLHVQVVAEYADMEFCVPVAQQVKAEECVIALEPVSYGNRFGVKEGTVEAYLKADEERWLLGTLCVGEKVFFLPSHENAYEMVERPDDSAVRTMLQEYQESCDAWEYVWLDGFADMDTLQVRTAREVSTDTPSTQWEAVEGTARELTCAEDCELVYVEQDGYRVASMKDFHSCAEEGGCGAVYFVGVKDGQAVCVIGIFIS